MGKRAPLLLSHKLHINTALGHGHLISNKALLTGHNNGKYLCVGCVHTRAGPCNVRVAHTKHGPSHSAVYELNVNRNSEHFAALPVYFTPIFCCINTVSLSYWLPSKACCRGIVQYRMKRSLVSSGSLAINHSEKQNQQKRPCASTAQHFLHLTSTGVTPNAPSHKGVERVCAHFHTLGAGQMMVCILQHQHGALGDPQPMASVTQHQPEGTMSTGHTKEGNQPR